MAFRYFNTDMLRWGIGQLTLFSSLWVDENTWETETRLVALETATPPTALGLRDVDPFTFVGNIMTVHLNDGTTRGPFIIKVGWILRETWVAGETYLAQNLIIGPAGPYNGNAYLVNVNHVADPLAFDPNATDGFANKLYSLLLPAAVPPVPINDIHVFVPGLMFNDQLLLSYGSVRPWTLFAALLGSLFKARVAATASTTVLLFQNTTQIGSITWAAGDTVPTVSMNTRADFIVGDVFEVRGPTIADITLEDIRFDFAGNRL